MSLVLRDDQIPRKKDVLWVERPAAGESQSFLIYSPTFQGVWAHWTGKESKPCYIDHSKCFKGHDGESRRWYAYLHCFSFKRNKPVFLQVPAGSAYIFKEQFKEGLSFRGMHVTVSRGPAKKSGLSFVGNEHMNRDPKGMPPMKDCIKSVLHMWKVFEVDLAVDSRLVRHLSEIPQEDVA